MKTVVLLLYRIQKIFTAETVMWPRLRKREEVLLYSYTNLQTAQVTVYRTGDETVEFLAGQSGEALQSVEAAVSEEDAGDGWTRAVYEIAALPDQTDFLEIRAEGGIVISNVSLDYKPDNSPIQKIRFDDSALDGVIGYDAEPLLKTAPANGISEIEYSTTDQDVAEYEHGVLKFVGIGEAAATASVADGKFRGRASDQRL